MTNYFHVCDILVCSFCYYCNINMLLLFREVYFYRLEPFCPIHDSGGAYGQKFADTLHRFWKKEHDWGWNKFMEWSKLSDGLLLLMPL
ncbi:hypothetical protein Taro_035207 [Colocasia esculenta]|uniref:MATH domain-containing protein n=1 Tax=Colocasia esculenta TaxID=4460 RepID=A0A843WHX7_COLES|nr:hypothetical protein [Colocasia esculenta]